MKDVETKMNCKKYTVASTFFSRVHVEILRVESEVESFLRVDLSSR